MKKHAHLPISYKLKRGNSRLTLLSAISIAALALWATSCKNDESLSTQPSSVDGIVPRVEISSNPHNDDATVWIGFGTWGVPVNIGTPPNNPTTNEQGPALSTDEHSLYFGSNRPGGSGGNDLWVSRRASRSDAFGEPVNLGPGINSLAGDNNPALSVDRLLLFFTSNRIGGAGVNDIYMSSRTDPTDDLSWGTPVRLGPDVNTAAFEFSPFITKFRGDCADDDDGEEGSCVAQLYFERGPSNVATDIYVVTIDAQGNTLGPAVAVTEVNSSDADGRPTVRFDDREMLLHSNRDGRGGNFDLFVSTRRSRNHPWSTPMPVDELNASIHEIHPYLSRDAGTLVFVRGMGTANEIMISHRDRGR